MVTAQSAEQVKSCSSYSFIQHFQYFLIQQSRFCLMLKYDLSWPLKYLQSSLYLSMEYQINLQMYGTLCLIIGHWACDDSPSQNAFYFKHLLQTYYYSLKFLNFTGLRLISFSLIRFNLIHSVELAINVFDLIVVYYLDFQFCSHELDVTIYD